MARHKYAVKIAVLWKISASWPRRKRRGAQEWVAFFISEDGKDPDILF
jgi:hypothetical protein